MALRPHPVHRTPTSAPARVTFHVSLPHGCFFRKRTHIPTTTVNFCVMAISRSSFYCHYIYSPDGVFSTGATGFGFATRGAAGFAGTGFAATGALAGAGLPATGLTAGLAACTGLAALAALTITSIRSSSRLRVRRISLARTLTGNSFRVSTDVSKSHRQ